MIDRTIPVVAVLGPTASGKSTLAEALAAEAGGELLNSDASAVYKELSIGVTKPPPEVRARVRYHLLDLATLPDGFSLMQYLDAANAAIDQVWARHKVPIVVGGSSLYVRALLDGYRPPDIEVPEKTRAFVRDLSAEEAQTMLRERDPAAFERIDEKNPRRVSRALELTLALGAPVPPPTAEPRPDLKILRLYLLPARELIKERIRARTLLMWEPWLEEVDRLEKKGLARWLDVRKPIGYASVLAYIRGDMSRDEAQNAIVNQTVKLAKKQRTWLKKEKDRPFSHHFNLDHDRQWSQLPRQALQLLRQFLS